MNYYCESLWHYIMAIMFYFRIALVSIVTLPPLPKTESVTKILRSDKVFLEKYSRYEVHI